MTLTLRDLKHLEIMAELESKPAPIPEVEAITEPSKPETLTEKLLTLANKLKVAGYVKQAENLEDSFGIYKKAETDTKNLYHTNNETGDDLLDFAHPDGDVEIAPAQDGNGDVETQTSKHKKIIDIVIKAEANTIPHTALIQKFMYLKNFVSSNFLNTQGFDQNDPQYKIYLEMASDLFNVAEELENEFNAPGSSSEPTAVMVINEAFNKMLNAGEGNPKFNNMGDVNNFINLFISKIQKARPVKKTAIIEMLKKTLNIKVSDTRSEAEFNEFQNIVKDVVETVNYFLKPLSDQKFSGITLYDNNKTIGEVVNTLSYKVNKALNAPASYSSSKQTAANIIDDLLKSCFSFVSNLNETMIASLNNPKDPFTNHQYPKQFKNVLNGVNNRFLTFYNRYLSQASQYERDQHVQWHSQFLTPKMLEELINPELNKLNTLKRFVQTTVLEDSYVKKSEPIINYLKQYLGFIDKLSNDFKKLLAETPLGESILLDDNGNITVSQIQKVLSSPDMKQMLKFDTINNFKQSIAFMYQTLVSKLEELINNNNSLQPSRDNLLSQIATMNKVVGK